MKNKGFYNELAEQYDSMINFEKALPRRMDLLSRYILPNYKTSADLGCGSGIDSISMAKLGLSVVAFDQSEEMLNLARAKANELTINSIKFSDYKIHKIPNDYNDKFDLITSLGNTVSNISHSKLNSSVIKIYKMLSTGGSVLIQVVNYNRLIHAGERILNITNNDTHTFVRFYDYFEDHIHFNILSFETNNPASKKLITTTVFNNSAEFLTNLFSSVGFVSVKLFGDLNQSPFDEVNSKDIILLASK